MSQEELIINLNELDSDIDNIINGRDFVYIIKNGKTIRYNVIDTNEKLFKYYSNFKKHDESQTGTLVTCECTNVSMAFYNAIFLKKFKVDSYCEPKVEDSLYLSFDNCIFFEEIELLGGDYKRIKFNDSIVKKSVFIRYINCEKIRINNVVFEEDLILENSEIIKFNANGSNFKENLLFQQVNVLNDFILDKVKGNKDLAFIDCRFEGLSKLELDINGELNFSQSSFYKKSEINFDEINGKFSLYRTNFADKCYLDYELLENKKYRPLIFDDDYKKTKWNFMILAEVYKSNGRTEQYLETFYYFKKYERLEKKQREIYGLTLLDHCIGITTKYYTSWKRTLLSMCFIIIAFFFLYSCFPDMLLYQGKPLYSKNLFSLAFDMIKEGNLDIKLLISKFGNVIYFTTITFTTVGYGDITPLNWMKMATVLESFFGIFFTSSFVVTLSRRSL